MNNPIQSHCLFCRMEKKAKNRKNRITAPLRPHSASITPIPAPFRPHSAPIPAPFRLHYGAITVPLFSNTHISRMKFFRGLRNNSLKILKYIKKRSCIKNVYSKLTLYPTFSENVPVIYILLI